MGVVIIFLVITILVLVHAGTSVLTPVALKMNEEENQ
jgi:Na+-transporting methylmalonyl-CoA/oxaloacetate decarboxylase gamma subunit